jgi:hypothetical protein
MFSRPLLSPMSCPSYCHERALCYHLWVSDTHSRWSGPSRALVQASRTESTNPNPGTALGASIGLPAPTRVPHILVYGLNKPLDFSANTRQLRIP